MKQLPFYEDYLHMIVVIKLVEVIRAKGPSSLAEFRRAFNEYHGLAVSYEQFRTWVDDLGIRIEKSASFSLPEGVGQGAQQGAPPAPVVGPQTGPPTGQRGSGQPVPMPQQTGPMPPLEYMFGQQQGPNQQPQQPVTPMAPGRGGIQI